MAIALDSNVARVVTNSEGKVFGFTQADLDNARAWYVRESGKSGKGILSDVVILAWNLAGEPEVEKVVKSTGSTNVNDVIATVTYVNRRSDGTPGAKRSQSDVTRGMMRAIRTDDKGNLIKGAPAALDYVAASGKDDDSHVVTEIETAGGKVFTYDYESDTWSSVSASKLAADRKIAELMETIARLETANGSDES